MTVVDRTASMVPESLRTAGCAAWRLEGLKAGRLEGEDAAKAGSAPGDARRPGPANQTASQTATPAADTIRRKRRKGVPVTESSSPRHVRLHSTDVSSDGTEGEKVWKEA
jgi:hypothetical protein